MGYKNNPECNLVGMIFMDTQGERFFDMQLNKERNQCRPTFQQNMNVANVHAKQSVR